LDGLCQFEDQHGIRRDAIRVGLEPCSLFFNESFQRFELSLDTLPLIRR
jgi:hypothetical protein